MPAAKPKHPYEINKNYLIRTVTFYTVGRVVAVYDQELVLEDASWVAETGQFSNALNKSLEKIPESEIEPFVNNVIIGRGSIVDATIYNHKLPKDVK